MVKSPPLEASPTPRLVLEFTQLRHNIEHMAAHVRRLGASLRPHFKTHKSPEIMRLQLEAGARGITVATLHEAEIAVAAGVRDLLIAYPPVGTWRLRTIDGLLDRARVIVACSEWEHARLLAELDRPLEYYWEVDCGARRLGSAPGAPAVEVIERIAVESPQLRLAGIMTFAGHSYVSLADDARTEVLLQEEIALATTAAALRARGLDPGELSAGSTPLAGIERGVATEYRFGNYVFFDATQVSLGSATQAECALAVEACVVGRPAEDRMILDSGSKALAAERMSLGTASFGFVRGHPELVVESLYEEHAICHIEGTTSLAVNDRVEVVPNHACTCANLHSSYNVRFADGSHEVWAIPARGWGVDLAHSVVGE